MTCCRSALADAIPGKSSSNCVLPTASRSSTRADSSLRASTRTCGSAVSLAPPGLALLVAPGRLAAPGRLVPPGRLAAPDELAAPGELAAPDELAGVPLAAASA